MLPVTEINPRHEFICHHLSTYQFSMFQVCLFPSMLVPLPVLGNNAIGKTVSEDI